MFLKILECFRRKLILISTVVAFSVGHWTVSITKLRDFTLCYSVCDFVIKTAAIYSSFSTNIFPV